MAVYRRDQLTRYLIPATDLWKYINDTTILETLSKNQDSHIQAA